MYQVSAAPN